MENLSLEHYLLLIIFFLNSQLNIFLRFQHQPQIFIFNQLLMGERKLEAKINL
jgi:hypothetical protein